MENLITVLVCSANVGNAEPTPSSFGEWIPDDGNIDRPLASTKYPVDGASDVTSALSNSGRKFDIIVLGMQEAAFAVKKSKVDQQEEDEVENGKNTPLDDCAGTEGHRSAAYSPHHIGRKVQKANLVVRQIGLHGLSVRNVPATSSALQYDTKKFQKLIASRCPSYKIMASKLRGEMRLYLLVKIKLSLQITDLVINGENTGIGSIMANKGGIIVTFTLRNTRLSFFTAHLAAHEGEQYYAARNHSIAEIFRGAKTDPNLNFLDAAVLSHHIFVCGDLNYRIRLDDEVSGSSCPQKKEDDGANGSHFAQAKALVEAEDWTTLNDGDELQMALTKKECLCGFKTLPCNFPPTFKVARGEGYQYNEKRTPSYTDRILWKSADGMRDNVLPFLYEPCPDFITSDHKPIRGGFTVKLNKGPSAVAQTETKQRNFSRSMSSRGGVHNTDYQVNLLISNIKCRTLPAMDSSALGGKADPYILFVSDPKPLLWNKKGSSRATEAWPSTKVIYRDLNPIWKHDIHLTLNNNTLDSKGDITLTGAMLHVTVFDEDFSSGDDVIGTVSLNLDDLCDDLDFSCKQHKVGEKKRISRPLLRNGLEQGMFECTVIPAFITNKDTKNFLKMSNATKVRSNKRNSSRKAKFTRWWKSS